MAETKLERLQRADVQQEIAAYRTLVSSDVALQLHARGHPDAALIAEQVGLLHKAGQKLPSFVEHSCLLLPKAFEQASGEAEAAALQQAGERAADLSLGLGVDAWQLSRNFRHLTGVDADAELCALARHNLPKLGARVDVIHSTAEDWLARYAGPRFDLLYLDPDRRPDARRRFSLAESRPNVPVLLPELRRAGRRLLLKLSPLADLTALEQELPHLAELEVLSKRGEVKAVRALLDFDAPAARVLRRARCLRAGGNFELSASLPLAQPSLRAEASYLYEVDAALRHSGLAPALGERFPGAGSLAQNGAVWLSDARQPGFPGRGHAVVARLPFSPRKLKRYRKEAGLEQAEIGHVDYPGGVKQLRRQLGLFDNGPERLLIAADQEGHWWAFHLRPLP